MTQQENAETTPTLFVSVGEVRFAYRRFGKAAGTPLVLLQHFRGSMDNWDPALLNGFAQDRTVIIFDNTGVGFSTFERNSQPVLVVRRGVWLLPPSVERRATFRRPVLFSHSARSANPDAF